MTNQEIAFKEFESKYRYDWYAQPEGGEKTVIFSYYPKGQYSSDKGDYQQPIKFEAESLEYAFNYAFVKEGLTPMTHYYGKITDFNVAKWAMIHPVTRYFSIGEQKWKKMPEYEVAV